MYKGEMEMVEVDGGIQMEIKMDEGAVGVGDGD
jgi:hypothetical protein